MVRIRFENPVRKCRGKSILVVCVHYPHAGECVTALRVIFFVCAERLFCRMIRYWYIYSCGKVQHKTHLKLLLSFVFMRDNITTRIICILSNSQACWRIWTYALDLNYLLVTNILRLKMANLSELVGFALAVTTRCKKESRMKSSFSTALEIWIASKSNTRLQIEPQINWIVDASSRGIQLKIHLKSNC